MFLRCRPACQSDLGECLSKIRDFEWYSADARAMLLDYWRTLVNSGAASFAVIEDEDAPLGERIVWFSFKVFVTDEYLSYMRTRMPPCLSLQLLADWQRGRTALLDTAAVCRANSRMGLNMVTLNYGTPRKWLTGEKRDWVASKSVEWSWYSAGGYGLKSISLELYGEFEWAWAEGFGLRVQNRYTAQEMPFPDRPRLYGIDREEGRACGGTQTAGTQTSVLFRSQRPCFGFKPLEQELLLWAMMDLTDEELAERLTLATVTIKKRWQSIYERVALMEPALLGDISEAKRGAEKKRRLLGYLRHHMEELRPYEADDGK